MSSSSTASSSSRVRGRDMSASDTAPRKMSKRPGHTAMMETNVGANSLILPNPKWWCQLMCHPFCVNETERELLSANQTHIMEVFVPSTFFKSTPQSMMPDCGDPDSVIKYRQILNILGFLANTADAKIKKVTMTINAKGEEKAKVDLVESPNSAMVTFEVVTSATNKNITVGYRWRLTEHSSDPDAVGFLEILSSLLQRNDDVVHKQLTGVVRGGGGGGNRRGEGDVDPASHHFITTRIWNSLCVFYAGRDCLDVSFNTNRSFINDVAHADSPFNPQTVFSINRSLEQATNVGADPKFIDSEIYWGATSNNGNYCLFNFPYPQNVYCLALSAVEPTRINSTKFPMRRPDPTSIEPARAEYIRIHGAEHASMFEAACVDTTMTQEANDIKGLTRRVTEEKKNLFIQFPNPADYHRELKLKQQEWNRNMTEIIHPTGDAAPAIQCIASYRDSYLHKNNNSMCMRRELKVKNTTRLDDMMIHMLAWLETIITVKTSHKLCLQMLLASLGVYLRVDMNCHQLLLGPPTIGKSFAMLLLNKFLIPGTCTMLSNLTPKAFLIPGKQNDSQILLFEDAPASILGANGGNRGGKGISDDLVNMMKNLLTSMESSLITLEMDPKRAGVIIRAETCVVCMFAMNDPSDVFQSAILARFNVNVSSEAERPGEWADTAAIQTRLAEPAVKAIATDLSMYWCRTQVLFAEIMYRIASGILCDINIEAAMIFFGLVAQRAHKQRGINMKDARKLNRFKQIVKVLVVWDVIDLFWDSPMSPLAADAKHDPDHFLLVEPYLVATRRHATMALGLLSNQWQDGVTNNVVSTMKRLLFPKSDEKFAKMKQPIEESVLHGVRDRLRAFASAPIVSNHPRATSDERRDQADQKEAYDGMQEQSEFWMYDTCHMPGPHLSAPHGNRGQSPSDNEIIAHIAKQLMNHLNPKPLLSEVEAVIRALTIQTSTESRKVRNSLEHADTEEIKEGVFVMVLQADKIRMSLKVLENSTHSDSLFDAVSEVLTELHNASPTSAPTATYLYGETDPSLPFLFRTIKVNKNNNHSVSSSSSDFRVWNARFHDPSLVNLSNSLLSMVDGDASVATRRSHELFDNTVPWRQVDTDIDELAARDRCTKHLRIGHNQQMKQPSTIPSLCEKQLDAMRLPTRTIVYPDTFTTMNRGAWIRQVESQQQQANSSEFFMSTRTQNDIEEARQIDAEAEADVEQDIEQEIENEMNIEAAADSDSDF